MSENTLKQLADSGPGWAAERAQTALLIAQAYGKGQLEEDEFKELMLDLVRTDKLDEEADDLETKTMLVTAVYAVAQVA
jgi:polyhydroxyalkanoate synthesis regulator phasin